MDSEMCIRVFYSDGVWSQHALWDANNHRSHLFLPVIKELAPLVEGKGFTSSWGMVAFV